MPSARESAKRRRFDACVMVHLEDLYRAARRLTRKPADAEDLVQETCMRAFQAIEQLRQPEAARAWLFAILRSVFLRHAERSAMRPTPANPEILETFARSADFAGMHQEISSRRHTSALEDIRESILGLAVPFREAIVLAHVGGFSYKEMAHILEVPIGTVMSRLHRARRLLRLALGEPAGRPRDAEPSR